MAWQEVYTRGIFWSRGSSLLRYLLKSFLDNFVFAFCTVQPYIPAVELDAVPSYFKAGATNGSLCTTFKYRILNCRLFAAVQFSTVLIARRLVKINSRTPSVELEP